MIIDPLAVRETDDRDFDLTALQLMDLAIDAIPGEHEESPHLEKWQRLHAAMVDVLVEYDPQLKAAVKALDGDSPECRPHSPA